jgi:hypothetical protein
LSQAIVDEIIKHQTFYEMAVEGYLQQLLTLLLRSAQPEMNAVLLIADKITADCLHARHLVFY